MDYKYNSDSQAVRWSTIVLCASFLLVYVVLYYVKGDIFKGGSFDEENNGRLTVSEINTEIDYSMKSNSGVESNISVLNDGAGSDSGNFQSLVSDNTIAGENTINKISEMIVLSGTHSFYGSLDFVDLLGISYKYVLKDDKGIYFLNMDGYTYDFSDIARKLGGNLYIMNTESEILANKLFGDKVTFINIPEYANKKVLMLLNVNNQTWLLAMDYNLYHQSKPYLKSLFIY